MSCIWNLFTRKRDKKHSEPRILVESSFQNPVSVGHIPDSISELRILESALISHIVSLHYNLEETKKRVAYQMSKGASKRTLDLLAQKTHITEKKLYYESQLKKVQTKIQTLQV